MGFKIVALNCFGFSNYDYMCHVDSQVTVPLICIELLKKLWRDMDMMNYICARV